MIILLIAVFVAGTVQFLDASLSVKHLTAAAWETEVVEVVGQAWTGSTVGGWWGGADLRRRWGCGHLRCWTRLLSSSLSSSLLLPLWKPS